MDKFKIADNWPSLKLTGPEVQVLQFISLAVYANDESPIDEKEIEDLIKSNDCTLNDLLSCGGLIAVGKDAI